MTPAPQHKPRRTQLSPCPPASQEKGPRGTGRWGLGRRSSWRVACPGFHTSGNRYHGGAAHALSLVGLSDQLPALSEVDPEEEGGDPPSGEGCLPSAGWTAHRPQGGHLSLVAPASPLSHPNSLPVNSLVLEFRGVT